MSTEIRIMEVDAERQKGRGKAARTAKQETFPRAVETEESKLEPKEKLMTRELEDPLR